MNTPLVALLSLCVSLAAADALADDKAACVDDASSGQNLRDASKLLEARDKFRLCAAEQCPAVVQKECEAWLADVERSLPTVVVTAKDGSGADVIDVAVTVDGKSLTTRLDGSALPLDPGPHLFHFQRGDGVVLDQKIVVREGAKAQSVAVVLQSATPPSTAPAPPPGAPARSAGKNTLFWVGVVTAGAGVATGLVAGGFALGKAGSLSGECDVNHVCESSAAQGDYNSAKTMAVVSDVGFVVGGVGAVLALVGLFTSQPSKTDTSSASLWVGIGTVGVEGRFQ